MLPVLEGIMLAMQGGVKYEPDNPDAVWDLLYCVVYRNGPQGEEAASGEDGSLIVSRALMERYAIACFANLAQLPEIPVSQQMLSYDAATEKYILKPSEQGEEYGEIYAAQTVTTGLYRASVNLFAGDDELPYDQYEFTLVDNDDAANTERPSFAYAVRGAKKVEMDPGSMAR